MRTHSDPSNKQLIRLIRELNRRILESGSEGLHLNRGKNNDPGTSNEEEDHKDKFFLRAVSPNWLTTPCPEVIIGGGPGGEPQPLKPQLPGSKGKGHDDSTSYVASDLVPPSHFTIDHEGFNVLRMEVADPMVKVAILDTAPSQADLDKVLACEWAQRHELFQQFINKHKFAIDELARLNISLPDSRIRICGHNYRMIDHGLFVAGIIRDLAPMQGSTPGRELPPGEP